MTWQEVWTRGIAPQLPTAGLAALADELRAGGGRLLQMAATEPLALPACQDWPCERADAVAFCFWQGWGLTTVRAVQDAWEEAMYGCTLRLGREAASAPWLNWHDGTPREAMLAELLPLVEAALAARGVTSDAASASAPERRPAAVAC